MLFIFDNVVIIVFCYFIILFWLIWYNLVLFMILWLILFIDVVVINVCILCWIVFNKCVWCELFNLLSILFNNKMGYFLILIFINLILVNLMDKVVVCCCFWELYVWVFMLFILKFILFWCGLNKLMFCFFFFCILLLRIDIIFLSCVVLFWV